MSAEDRAIAETMKALGERVSAVERRMAVRPWPGVGLCLICGQAHPTLIDGYCDECWREAGNRALSKTSIPAGDDAAEVAEMASRASKPVVLSMPADAPAPPANRDEALREVEALEQRLGTARRALRAFDRPTAPAAPATRAEAEERVREADDSLDSATRSMLGGGMACSADVAEAQERLDDARHALAAFGPEPPESTPGDPAPATDEAARRAGVARVIGSAKTCSTCGYPVVAGADECLTCAGEGATE